MNSSGLWWYCGLTEGVAGAVEGRKFKTGSGLLTCDDLVGALVRKLFK